MFHLFECLICLNVQSVETFALAKDSAASAWPSTDLGGLTLALVWLSGTTGTGFSVTIKWYHARAQNPTPDPLAMPAPSPHPWPPSPSRSTVLFSLYVKVFLYLSSRNHRPPPWLSSHYCTQKDSQIW
jgi:hypothetical protein